MTEISGAAHGPVGRSRLPENFRDSLSCHSANTSVRACKQACLLACACIEGLSCFHLFLSLIRHFPLME